MKAKPPSNKPRVYSYIRFSTPEQKLGDSLRRQIERAKAFAAKNNLEFDETLRDEGLSGYHGVHRKKGMLGRFLKRAQAGEIPRGSILVVEKMSRLGREDVYTTIKTILNDLLEHGIKLHTLDAGVTYDANSINGPQFLGLVYQIAAANRESEDKSDYGKENYKRKRDLARQGVIKMTKRCHHWLKLSSDRKSFHIVPEAAAAVRMIFELYPHIGTHRLVQRLNAEAPWKPPGRKGRSSSGWRASYVKKIVQDRSVLGEYQPHILANGRRVPEGEVIHDYYPRIIANEQWYAVQGKIDQNRRTGGKVAAARSLFQGLVFCAYCGGPMYREGKGQPPRGQRYLTCDYGKRKHRDEQGHLKCGIHRVRYDEVETTILEKCIMLRPESVLPNETEQKRKQETLIMRIAAAEGELKNLKVKINEVDDSLFEEKGKTPKNGDRIARWETRLADLEERKTACAEQLNKDQSELRNLQYDHKSFKHWQQDVSDLKKAIEPDEAIDLRLRLKSHLRDFISKIEIFAQGYPRVYDPDKDYPRVHPLRVDTFAEEMEAQIEEADPKFLKNPATWAFIKRVMQMRLSKKGRFFRVFFKGGSWVDLAPDGSVGSSSNFLDKKKTHWRFTSPDLSLLWDEVMKNKPSVNAYTCKRKATKTK